MKAADPKPPKAVGRARLPILFGAMVAVIAAVIALLAQLQKDREAWVRHTLEVESSLSELSNSVYRVEALERGYLITGGENYIRFYERERAIVPAQLAELGALTAGNLDERTQVVTLRVAVQRKLTELDGGDRARQAGASDAALATVKGRTLVAGTPDRRRADHGPDAGRRGPSSRQAHAQRRNGSTWPC